jgi:hypothetical protein
MPAAICRPWLAIQILCQVNMSTAIASMEPLKISCRDPQPRARDALRDRYDDANDDAGFDDFPEDDNQRADHWAGLSTISFAQGIRRCPYLTTRKPSVVSS